MVKNDFCAPKVALEVRPQLSSMSQEMPPTRAVRVPDAMQRFFSDASQRAGTHRGGVMGPGSAAHRLRAAQHPGHAF